MKKIILLLAAFFLCSLVFGQEREKELSGKEIYEQGMKIYQDYSLESKKKAFNLFEESHKMGYVPGSVRYGECIAAGIGTVRETDKAETVMKEAIPKLADYLDSDPNSLYELGNTLLMGLGVPKRVFEGYRFLLKAASQNHLYAAETVALCLYQGIGCEKNLEEAFKWFEKSEKLGSSISDFYLSNFYFAGLKIKKDIKKAFEYLEKGEKAGEANCLYRLGYIYINGLETEKDPEKGIKYLTLAAEKEYPKAMSLLGQIYYKGKICEKDYDRAMFWLEKAAAHNDSIAVNICADEKEKAKDRKNK